MRITSCRHCGRHNRMCTNDRTCVKCLPGVMDRALRERREDPPPGVPDHAIVSYEAARGFVWRWFDGAEHREVVTR